MRLQDEDQDATDITPPPWVSEFTLEGIESFSNGREESDFRQLLEVLNDRYEPRRYPPVPGWQYWQVVAIEEVHRDNLLEERILRKVRDMIEERFLHRKAT